jgi:hypothetical protein
MRKQQKPAESAGRTRPADAARTMRERDRRKGEDRENQKDAFPESEPGGLKKAGVGTAFRP